MATEKIDWSKYDVDRNNYVSLDELRSGQEAQAEKNNDYTIMFTEPYDKIKADSDKDGKISKVEYNNYIIYRAENTTGISKQNINEVRNDTKHHYSLDYSFYIVIGMMCITAIIIKWVHRKPFQ